MKIRPSLAYVDPEPLKIIAKYIYNWPYFSQELFRKCISFITKGMSNKS